MAFSAFSSLKKIPFSPVQSQYSCSLPQSEYRLYPAFHAQAETDFPENGSCGRSDFPHWLHIRIFLLQLHSPAFKTVRAVTRKVKSTIHIVKSIICDHRFLPGGRKKSSGTVCATYTVMNSNFTYRFCLCTLKINIQQIFICQSSTFWGLCCLELFFQ